MDRQRQFEIRRIDLLLSAEVVEDAQRSHLASIHHGVGIASDFFLAISEAGGKTHRPTRQLAELTHNACIEGKELAFEHIDAQRRQPFDHFLIVREAGLGEVGVLRRRIGQRGAHERVVEITLVRAGCSAVRITVRSAEPSNGRRITVDDRVTGARVYFAVRGRRADDPRPVGVDVALDAERAAKHIVVIECGHRA